MSGAATVVSRFVGVLVPADRRVAEKAIVFVYGNLGVVSRVQLLFPPIVLWLFWGQVSHGPALLWGAALIAVYIARLILVHRFHAADADDRDPWAWGRYFTATAVVSGLLWGAGGVLFHVPGAEMERAVLYVLIVGSAAGAVIVSSYWIISYLVYVLPGGTLLVSHLLVHGNQDERVLALVLTLFVVVLIFVARDVRDQAYASIGLGFENDALIERLAAEKGVVEKASEAKTRFMASASHDLRQPVHALSLLAHSLESEVTTSRGKRIHTHLSRTTRSLRTLLDGLLDLSRLDAEATTIRLEGRDVAAVARELEEDYAPLAHEKGLELRVRARDGMLRSDFALLGRLLGNLLSNAIRYTERGGVLLSFRRREGGVLIQVWDTGVGIDESRREDIFQEFYRVDGGGKEADEGVGLGLSICRRIATLLELPLTVRSRVGRGSVFGVFVADGRPVPPGSG